MRRRGPAALVLVFAIGFILAAGAAAPANAAVGAWSIIASPATMIVGVATNVTLTVTAVSQSIGCMTVSVPSGFTVLSVSIASAPGSSWIAMKTGTGPTLATFATNGGKDRLVPPGQARFVIRAIPTRTPLGGWAPTAYHNFPPCTNQVGPPVLPLPPFAIGPGATATPKPTPKPTPPPGPTPVPTALPPGATRGPTDSPTPSTLQSSPSDSSLPSASPPPSSSPSPTTAVAIVLPRPTGGLPPDTGDVIHLDVRALPAGGTVHLDDMQALGTTAVVAWLVPGLFLSLPGLLIVLIVLAQAGFASAFVPITRRVLGAGSRRRSRDTARRPA